MYEKFDCEINEGICTIIFNQTSSMNALSKEVFRELLEVIAEIKENSDVQIVIFSGKGKAFVAGADISEMSKLDILGARDRIRMAHKCFHEIENLEIPTIAAVNGYALGGGCELALVCDIRIATEKSQFGQPEVGLGIIPCYGGTQRLPRLIGKGKAMELILTGDFIDGTEAYRIGLVQKLVKDDDLLEVSKDMARRIMKKGPLAIKTAKQAINKGLFGDMSTSLAYEESAGSVLFGTEDQKEGMQAFLEKREPRFAGK